MRARPRRLLGQRIWAWCTFIGWRHVVGVIAAFVALLPLVYVFSASFNATGTMLGSNELFASFSLENYQDLLSNPQAPYATWWVNTMVLATLDSTLAVTLSTLAAYAFSRLRFRGRRPGLVILILIQVFPQFLSLVAIFLLLDWVGSLFPAIGLGTLSGLLLVYMGGALGITTYLMAGFMNSIPREIDEAARIDGAGHLRIFLQMIVPLSTPLIVALVLINFMLAVGEFAIASVVLPHVESQTVAVGLTQFISVLDGRNARWGMFAAGAVLAALPVLVLFFLLQRYVVSGLASGSVK
jgi:arabinogalactan oligomer/maltooligosaccharide transport system permease protein